VTSASKSRPKKGWAGKGLVGKPPPLTHTQLNVAILRVNIKVPGESFTGAQRFAFARFSLAIKHLTKDTGHRTRKSGTWKCRCRKENEEKHVYDGMARLKSNMMAIFMLFC